MKWIESVREKSSKSWSRFVDEEANETVYEKIISFG